MPVLFVQNNIFKSKEFEKVTILDERKRNEQEIPTNGNNTN